MAFAAWLLLLVLVGWWAWRYGRSIMGWIVLGGWLTLPLYNAWVVAHCPGDCAIRVDLVFMLPILSVLSVGWLAAVLWKKYKKRNT